jgi:hypothetical protein
MAIFIMERIKMKLTTEQLRQIIKEELRLLTENTGIPKIDNLLAQNDVKEIDSTVESIIQGLELADASEVPVDYQLLLINKDKDILKALARSPAGSQMKKLLHHIATVPNHYTTLISIARNPLALPKTLEMLGRKTGGNMANIVVHVAKNPSTPMKTLIELSMHRAWYVRAAIAGRDDVPETILKNLLGDRQPTVRRYAQENLNKRKSL